MAITQLYTGTEAVAGTEWSITTDTSGPDVDTNVGVFQIWLDVSDLVAGDELRIRGYEKVRSGDTQRVFIEATLVGIQSQNIWVSPTFVLANGWDFTLQAITGTVTVLWSVRQVA